MSKSTVYLTRKEHFSSAHQLKSSELSPEENAEIFGKCLNIHGHNYILKVTIKGCPNQRTGMVMNITDFKKIIRDEVLIYLDHKFIDEDVQYFKNIPSTCENLAVWIWNQIDKHLPTGVAMHRVKLRETENNYAEYYGESK